MLLDCEITKEWTLFLDRDGVINKRNFHGYITTVSEFEFLSHALDGIAKLSELFGHVIVVTNQQGIGKNVMTSCNLSSIHDYMRNEIKKAGGTVSEVFYAANLRGSENDRRKPLPFMGLEAKKKFPEIDFSKSIMVGDTDSDIQFGMNLGMYTVAVISEEKLTKSPDLRVNDLNELYKKLKK